MNGELTVRVRVCAGLCVGVCARSVWGSVRVCMCGACARACECTEPPVSLEFS